MWILILFVMMNSLLVYSESMCKLPNTGTVLFRQIDVHRRYCWSREELALLYTRRVMLELVPRQIPQNVPLILSFVQICLTTLKEQAAPQDIYDYMFAALADTFGGYLQTYGLPLLHEAYYEGYVPYDTAAEFHRLQDDLKAVLMTNGEGWTKPMEVRKHISRILPLKLPTSASSKPCSMLMHRDCFAPTSDDLLTMDNQSNSFIHLPLLDDNLRPNSIAVPFETHALFNLKSRSSYDVLIKYYIETTKCIWQLQGKSERQSEFDQMFSNWLKAKILPRLKDDDWYVGFSNVFRIEETIQQRGGIIAVSRPGEKREESSLFSELESESQFTKPIYIAVLLILVLTVLFICFLYWAFIKHCIMCCGKVDISGNSSAEPSDSASLLSGSFDNSNSNLSSAREKDKGSICRLNRSPGPDYKNNLQYSPSPGTLTEESHLTMTCGRGKGFPTSRCRKHNH